MRTLLIAGTVTLLVWGSTAFAAEDLQADDVDDTQTVEEEADSDELILEEVVVHGIRSSLRDAIDIKRK